MDNTSITQLLLFLNWTTLDLTYVGTKGSITRMKVIQWFAFNFLLLCICIKMAIGIHKKRFSLLTAKHPCSILVWIIIILCVDLGVLKHTSFKNLVVPIFFYPMHTIIRNLVPISSLWSILWSVPGSLILQVVMVYVTTSAPNSHHFSPCSFCSPLSLYTFCTTSAKILSIFSANLYHAESCFLTLLMLTSSNSFTVDFNDDDNDDMLVVFSSSLFTMLIQIYLCCAWIKVLNMGIVVSLCC